MTMLRWGVLGAANIARKRVVPAIQSSQRGRVVAIASRSRERAEEAAHEANISVVYDDYAALLASDEVDAVYLPLPNSEHHRWAIAAAEAGKHVLCEKPFALDAQQAEEMLAAAQRNGVLLAEAFMYRHHPLVTTLLKLLRDGAIGELRLVRSTFTFGLVGAGNIRLDSTLGGGALLDVGCYGVSLARLMAGSEPTAVAAVADYGPTGVDESFAGVLRFPGSVLAEFDVSLKAAGGTSYEVIGTEGKLVVRQGFKTEANEEAELQLHANGEVSRIFIEPADQYQLMVEDFAKSVLDGRALRFAPEDAVANMRVLDQLRAAIQ